MITFPQISYMWSSRCLWRCGRRIVWAGVGVARCAIISAPTRQTWQTTSRRIILINATSVRSAAKSLGRVTLLKSTSKDCTMTSPSAAWFARKCFPRGRHWKLTWKVILCSRSSGRVIRSCNKFWCHSHLTMLNKILCAFKRCHLSSSCPLAGELVKMKTQMSSLGESTIANSDFYTRPNVPVLAS